MSTNGFRAWANPETGFDPMVRFRSEMFSPLAALEFEGLKFEVISDEGQL